MEIFWRLLLGHLMADFTLQTNYIAAWKRRNVWGMLVHCGIHPILYALLVWQYLPQVWLQIGPVKLTGYLCILLVFIAHFIEDEWRVMSVEKRGAPDNTFFYIWDQMIHYAILFALAPVVGGSAGGKLGFLYYPPISGVFYADGLLNMGWWMAFSTATQSETWVFVGMLIVILTHFTTVTIYFVEKDFFGQEYPSVQEKYISMAERMVVAGCILLPGFWWISVLAFWLMKVVLYKLRKIGYTSWTNILIGNITAILCGLIARSIL